MLTLSANYVPSICAHPLLFSVTVEGGTIVIPTFQIRKLRLGKLKELTQAHETSK